MSNTYTWTVKKMDVIPSLNNETNVVSCVYCTVSTTNGTTTVESSIIQTIPFNSSNAFVAYSNLTNDTVINWVKSLMEADRIQQIESILDDRLNESAPIIINQPLPWNS